MEPLTLAEGPKAACAESVPAWAARMAALDIRIAGWPVSAWDRAACNDEGIRRA
ncbi:hypothetical protein D9M68_918630 [compost metagenome]